MSCRPRDIHHSCLYNTGGVGQIILFDYRDFVSVLFSETDNSVSCKIDKIVFSDTNAVILDTVSESSYTEDSSNRVYSQSLLTFVRSIDGDKSSDLLIASTNKYIVLVKNRNKKAFIFGLDGGASISYSTLTDTEGNAEGYNISISNKSKYPILEIDINNIIVSGRIFTPRFNEKFN